MWLGISVSMGIIDNISHNKMWNFSPKRIIVLVDIDTMGI